MSKPQVDGEVITSAGPPYSNGHQALSINARREKEASQERLNGVLTCQSLPASTFLLSPRVSLRITSQEAWFPFFLIFYVLSPSFLNLQIYHFLVSYTPWFTLLSPEILLCFTPSLHSTFHNFPLLEAKPLNLFSYSASASSSETHSDELEARNLRCESTLVYQ